MPKFITAHLSTAGVGLQAIAVDDTGRVWASYTGTLDAPRGGFKDWIALPPHPDGPGDHARSVTFACGCVFHPEPDDNGIRPWLDRCETHDAADAMRDALEALTDPEGHIWHGGSGNCTGECRAVRAAIARARGTDTREETIDDPRGDHRVEEE